MPATLECILYRAFNVSEFFYQKSPLSDLYRAPDWETPPVYDGERMTSLERIENDSQTLIRLKRGLPESDFALLETMYCRSMDADEWRTNLESISPIIQSIVKPVRFNRVMYEYTCISHLTGNRVKQLYFKSSTVRRNKERICKALDGISQGAHERARWVLNHEGY